MSKGGASMSNFQTSKAQRAKLRPNGSHFPAASVLDDRNLIQLMI